MMVFIWSAEDARPGLVVENTRTKAENRFALVGYRYDVSNKTQLLTLVDLTDGLELFHGDETTLAAYLSEGYAPVTTPVRVFKLLTKL